MWGLGQDSLLGIVFGLCGGLGQHTLLGIFVGLCASGNTLLGIAVGLCGTYINGFKIILFLNIIVEMSEVSVSVSPPKLLKRISAHKQNHMALLPCFPINLNKRATIRQISYSQTCTFPQTVRRTGIC
jgi:hypothetical protein